MTFLGTLSKEKLSKNSCLVFSDNPQRNFTHGIGLDCPLNVNFMPGVSHLKTNGRNVGR